MHITYCDVSTEKELFIRYSSLPFRIDAELLANNKHGQTIPRHGLSQSDKKLNAITY